MSSIESASRELIELLLRNEITDEKGLNAARKKASIRHKLSSLLSNSQILSAARDEDEKQTVLAMLQLKPVRTISDPHSNLMAIWRECRPFPSR